jgi:hypothetical protein
MILNGETHDQWLKRSEKGIRCYAYVPRQMKCGTWVWREYYWRGLHRGPNDRQWWERALTQEDCVRRDFARPPPPAAMKPTK